MRSGMMMFFCVLIVFPMSAKAAKIYHAKYLEQVFGRSGSEKSTVGRVPGDGFTEEWAPSRSASQIRHSPLA